MAYIFDGLHYGVSDFSFAACSMVSGKVHNIFDIKPTIVALVYSEICVNCQQMLVGAISSAFLILTPPVIGLQGIWYGLSLFMGLSAVAGSIRLV